MSRIGTLIAVVILGTGACCPNPTATSSGTAGRASSGGGTATGGAGTTGAGLPAVDGGVFPGDFLSCGCYPPTSVCNLALNPGQQDCVECLRDADCPSQAPRCQSGACVECLQQSDCPAGEVCLVAQESLLFNCAPDCRIDGGVRCSGRQVCDPDSGICANPPGDGLACTQASDCPPYLAGCDDGRCYGCQSDADCPAGLSCESGGGLCLCDTQADVCAQVSSVTPTCILLGGAIPQCGCTGQGDCPAGTFCDQGLACVSEGEGAGGFPTCAQYSPAAPAYDPETGGCVACVTDSDCAAGVYAGPLSPVCLTARDGAQACGCRTAADCPVGDGCDFSNAETGQCAPRCDQLGGKSCLEAVSTGALSAYNALLPSEDVWTVFCQPATGGCQGCSTDGDCAGLYGSIAPACQDAGFGAAGGVCGCAADAQCGPGLVCDRTLGLYGFPGGSGLCAPACAAPSDSGGAGVSCARLASGPASQNVGVARECQAGSGHCVECLSATDCAAPAGSPFPSSLPDCEGDAGVCTGCLSAAECAAAYPGCLPSAPPGCGLCAGDGDCTGGAVCDLGGAAPGRCRYPCGDQSCPEAQPFCGDAGLCWQCRTTADCPPSGGGIAAQAPCVDGVCLVQ